MTQNLTSISIRLVNAKLDIINRGLMFAVRREHNHTNFNLTTGKKHLVYHHFISFKNFTLSKTVSNLNHPTGKKGWLTIILPKQRNFSNFNLVVG